MSIYKEGRLAHFFEFEKWFFWQKVNLILSIDLTMRKGLAIRLFGGHIPSSSWVKSVVLRVVVIICIHYTYIILAIIFSASLNLWYGFKMSTKKCQRSTSVFKNFLGHVQAKTEDGVRSLCPSSLSPNQSSASLSKTGWKPWWSGKEVRTYFFQVFKN